jgi:DNA polymerase-3 subunit beta
MEGDEVNIEFSNPKTPVLIKPVEEEENQDLLLLIMPLILQ